MQRGEKVNRKKYPWSGYIKNILENYPDCESAELQAIDAAISEIDGDTHKIEIIRNVLMRKTHTRKGAALMAQCSIQGVKEIEENFIKSVAKKLIKY